MKKSNQSIREREQAISLMKLRRQLKESKASQEQKQVVKRLVTRAVENSKIKKAERDLRRAKIERYTTPPIQVKKGTFKKVTKAYGYKSKLSNTLLGYSNAFNNNQSQNTSSSGPGRPKLVYKHISPISGQPVPAPQYYKDVRLFRKLQMQKANQVEQLKQMQYARQGVPPERIQQVQQMQQVRQVPIQQNMQVQNQPLQNGQVIPRGTPVWKWRRGVVGEEGGLFGKRQLIYGTPESFFN